MGNSTLLKIQGIMPTVIVLLAALMRLVPHPANVAPITAMALFSGWYLEKKYAVILPLAAMLLSDLFLGFHATMPFVYGSFIITAFIGMACRKYQRAPVIVGATLLSSLLFFLITNFGVWLVGGLYPRTIQGLGESYVFALPFFRNSLIGDLFYAGLFFGGYALIQSILTRKAVVKE